MRKGLTAALIVTLAIAGVVALNERGNSEAADEGPMLAHMVFFTVKDSSKAGKEKLVAACKKYLNKHPGTVYFSAGTRALDLDRPVNDQKFDVALHIVFKTKEAHDRYQTAKRHLKFIEENKDSWTTVRVFDSVVQP